VSIHARGIRLPAGLESTPPATVFSIRNGMLVVTDGPFTEAKEVVGGFAIFQLPFA
jgi:hypothetical protein